MSEKHEELAREYTREVIGEHSGIASNVADAFRWLDEQRAIDGLEFRKWLWLNHGCDIGTLYGDDGEMQCGKCRLDFKKSTIDVLVRHIFEQRAKDVCETWCETCLFWRKASENINSYCLKFGYQTGGNFGCIYWVNNPIKEARDEKAGH